MGLSKDSITAGVKFLSHQVYGWDETGQTHYRQDLLTFGADWSEDVGLTNVRILLLE